jgi:predicted acyl esterase
MGRQGLRILSCRAVAALAATVALLAAPAVAAAEPKPFGKVDCVPRDGVRWCEGTIATRVKSFDGVPLDVNVTLPETGDGDFPLIIQLHGWGGRKNGLSDSREFAVKGYAVLSYSARGFGHSCGSGESRAADPAGCAKGWIHLADSRYEVRDSQYLAGLLADEGLVDPQRIGAMGASYGGGQSLQLATLRDKVRLGALPGEADGRLVPWTSPGGKAMSLAAATPIVPWSDLVYSLLPNGRTLDYRVAGRNDDLSPIGVAKESYIAALYVSGESSGYYAPPGVDPRADIRTWHAVVQAGEPYQDRIVDPITREIAQNHSAYYLDARGSPAPLLISNGFTDDLFPVNEAVRYANKHRGATIAQLHFDYGHPRGQSKDADLARLRSRIHEWFDRYLKDDSTVTPLSGVEARTQTCPKSAPSGGPFNAPTWDALSPGEVRFGDEREKTVLSGADLHGTTLDPVAGGGACARTDATDQPGTATYRGRPAQSGYTLLGSPTVIANLDVRTSTRPQDTQLTARLWDVAPDGKQTLVARGVYRPDRREASVVFQLFPNGWRFEAGHVPKLELLGSDAPFLRPSNFPFTMAISDLELRLPVHEQPGSDVSRPRSPAKATR